MQKILRRLPALGILLMVCWGVLIGFTQVALADGLSYGKIAAVHLYREQPQQITYRSQQSLRDRADRAWQVVMFKRFQTNQSQKIVLRLVGFPGAVAVMPDQPLQVTVGSNEHWTAPPSSESQPLPANVGQYDFSGVMARIQANPPLRLAVPLTTQDTAELIVPPFVVQEWRGVANYGKGLSNEGVGE